MRSLCLIGVLLITACSDPSPASCAGLQVSEAWIREMPPGQQLSAGYMLFNNPGDQSVIIQRFSSPDFGRVELHETFHEGQQVKMRKLESLTIPATEGLMLQPGGWHLMLMQPLRPIHTDKPVGLVLHCETDELAVSATVRKQGPYHHEHHGSQL